MLLVTSRGTGRWVVPKGNPIDGLAPHDAAAVEALEEAGVSGTMSPHRLGSFSYLKVRKSGASQMMRVNLYALDVQQVLNVWPEAHERQRQWFLLNDAVDAVMEPELKALMAQFDQGLPAPKLTLLVRLRQTIRRLVSSG